MTLAMRKPGAKRGRKRNRDREDAVWKGDVFKSWVDECEAIVGRSRFSIDEAFRSRTGKPVASAKSKFANGKWEGALRLYKWAHGMGIAIAAPWIYVRDRTDYDAMLLIRQLASELAPDDFGALLVKLRALSLRAAPRLRAQAEYELDDHVTNGLERENMSDTIPPESEGGDGDRSQRPSGVGKTGRGTGKAKP